MASSEPTLVPEWLRCNGHGNSGGSAVHHFASASSHSDAPLLANSVRNRSSRTSNDIDPRAILDRSSSINSRRNVSNNGSSKHPYSSFSRSHRDKEREKEKERLGLGDFWERDSFEPLGKDSLRRTRSMVSRKQGDSFPHSDASDSKKIESNKLLQRNGIGDKPSSSATKVSFDKDFPSLGAGEKQVANVVRVASPGLSIAPHGLPIGNSALVGEGWSALAEVPVIIGSNNNGQPIHQPLATSVASSTPSGVLNAVSDYSNTSSCDSNTASGAPTTTGASGPSSGLNMAEALIQPPPATCSPPQLSVETQRLEQLALKKVKLLIPMTPAMPKALNSSDKLKMKSTARFGEISGANKVGMQPTSSSVSAVGHSSRGGPVTFDASKQSHGTKLFVLKPPWENGASVTSKDGSNSESGAGGTQTNGIIPSPAAPSSPAKSPNSAKASFMERRGVFSPLTTASSVIKRPLSPYAKSRSDFFNSVRKKTSMTTTVTSETSNSTQSLSEDKSFETSSASPRGTENDGLIPKSDSNDEDHKLLNGEKNSILCAEVIPDEEEAFLRSLGWKKDGDQEEGLTEEEISAFYQGVMKLKPSLNLSQGVQPALSILMESHAGKVGVASPRASSSDAAALKSN